jgi:pyrroline-5-carboxylate reductase
VATKLVVGTMGGTAALLERRDTLTVRREVTSPGGSTARGLDALERGNVRAAFSAALDAVLEGR